MISQHDINWSIIDNSFIQFVYSKKKSQSLEKKLFHDYAIALSCYLLLQIKGRGWQEKATIVALEKI